MVTSKEVLNEISRRLTYFHLRLKMEAENLQFSRYVPTLEQISQLLQNVSYRLFDDSETYAGSARAKQAGKSSSSLSPTHATEPYRVFLNEHSRKIYVDVNGPKWVEAREQTGLERMYFELLKGLLRCLAPEAEPTTRTSLELAKKASAMVREEREAPPLIDITQTTQAISMGVRAQPSAPKEEATAECPFIDTEVD